MTNDLVDQLTSATVLYYPTIEFRSDAWVKAALCVWDKIYRIVPPNYTPNDSDAVRQAADEDLIHSIVLTSGDLSDAAADFQLFIDNAHEFPAALQGHKDVRLHVDKIEDRLLPLLESLASKIDPAGWLSVSKPVADTYMLYLAESVARRRQIQKVTDDKDSYIAHTYFNFDGNFSSFVDDPEASEIAASVVLPQLLPDGFEQHSIERVINFRKRHAEARAAYRKSVIKLSEHLANVTDRAQTKEVISEFHNKLLNPDHPAKPKWQDYKWVALAVGIPMAANALINASDKSWGVAAGGVGVALFATLAEPHRSKRAAWKATDAYYHLEIQCEFVGTGARGFVLPSYSDTFHEFMDD